MSDPSHFALYATLRPSVPAEVVEWIASYAAGDPTPPTFESSSTADGDMSATAWLLGIASVRLETTEGRVPGTVHERRLSVQATGGYESILEGSYRLVQLLAPHCDDGIVAVSWTVYVADTDPMLFYVQDGVLFVGSSKTLPQSARLDGRTDRWRLGITPVPLDEYRRLGVADPEGMARRAEDTDEPALARHLLCRTVARALRDLPLDDLVTVQDEGDSAPDAAALRAAAERGAEAVLSVIDAGGDPLLIKNTPGWRLEEFERSNRYARSSARGSGRVIDQLVDGVAEVASSSLDAGPRPMEVGQIVTVTAPLPLTAVGPKVGKVLANGQRSHGDHRLRVTVPPGSRLQVTKVYDKGHAECRPASGDFGDWIRSSSPRAEVPKLVAPADDYRLHFLQPDDPRYERDEVAGRGAAEPPG